MGLINVYQQVFTLSLASNALHHRSGEPLSVLQALIEVEVPLAIRAVGDWHVVWGPVVWLSPNNTNGGPDNVWYVAKQSNVKFPDGVVADAYVVAIAGTASTSKYDALHEDFDVNTVVDLKAWIAQGLNTTPIAATNVDDANVAYISMGTAEGVSVLLNTVPPNDGGAQQPGTLLSDFLATIPSSARIIFTGHSLGGALSPALAAAWWLDSKLPKSVTQGNVLTYPTAGPSPFNLNFVKLFESTFPATPSKPDGYKNWNINLVNTLDVVPLAWCTDASL